MSQESIPEISVSGVQINHIRPWLIQPTTIQDIYVPVTLQLGFPIVDIPGCVEMHKDNKNHISGQADLLRRAMGKKKRAELEKQKQGFIAGAVKNGITKKLMIKK